MLGPRNRILYSNTKTRHIVYHYKAVPKVLLQRVCNTHNIYIIINRERERFRYNISPNGIRR